MKEIYSEEQYKKGILTYIPVIAAFDDKGNAYPVYFEIKKQRYKVIDYVMTKFGQNLVFDVKYDSSNLNKELRIVFYNDGKWGILL